MTTTSIKWLTTLDLENYIDKYGSKDTKAAFLGVFAINHLPKRIPYLPLLFIVNTNTANLPGQHWKAIYVSNDHIGEVFDSLATPLSIQLQCWMNTFTNKWSLSNLVIQNPLSPTCGAYVLYFVMTRLKRCETSNETVKFTNNVFLNDQLVKKFYFNMAK